jgi:hypothetical protein
MRSVRLTVFGLAAVFGVAATASDASAFGGPPVQGGCSGPFCNQGKYPTLASYVFKSHSTPLPTFQAAPWYLYWPYDAHFLTPAPVHGAFYGPPGPGNFPVNPYFPGPAYPYSAYGPIPGGAAPGVPYPTAPYPPGPAPMGYPVR